MDRKISAASLAAIRAMQQNEVDEFHIYRAVAARIKKADDRETLLDIAQEELKHAMAWQRYTGAELKPRGARVLWYRLLARVFGYTFALKLMEKGEDTASRTYQRLAEELPEAARIAQEEEEHENRLLALLDEERLQYVGSMVLGLNDALVEITGTLAGLSMALQHNRLVALSGLITGISATLSMAASSYLSAKNEGDKNALRSALYTGVMYLVTVILLVLPYLLLPAGAYLPALALLLATVALIIAVFNYYIAVARSEPFGKRFLEMFLISGGVMLLSFVAGILVKQWLGIDL